MMKIISDPRLGEKYKVVPTSETVKQSKVSRFLPKEGVDAIYDEFYHSRYSEGAIQLFEIEKEKEGE